MSLVRCLNLNPVQYISLKLLFRSSGKNQKSLEPPRSALEWKWELTTAVAGSQLMSGYESEPPSECESEPPSECEWAPAKLSVMVSAWKRAWAPLLELRCVPAKVSVMDLTWELRSTSASEWRNAWTFSCPFFYAPTGEMDDPERKPDRCSLWAKSGMPEPLLKRRAILRSSERGKQTHKSIDVRLPLMAMPNRLCAASSSHSSRIVEDCRFSSVRARVRAFVHR